MERMSAVDAQTHWMSAKIPNDQFLLFAFTGVRDPLESVAEALRARASAIPDLLLRVQEVPAALDLPYWVATVVDTDQVRVHDDVVDWDGCLVAVAGAMGDQLDLSARAWRVHLFGPLRDVPGAVGDASLVAVLQIGHALCDGTRASRIARQLFDDRPLPAPGPGRGRWIEGRPVSIAVAALGVARTPTGLGVLAWRAVRAHRAHRDLLRELQSGRLPPPPTGAPLTRINSAPGEHRVLRVVTTSSERLREIGGSVTLGALSVIAGALYAHLAPGDMRLRAEVTMAKPGIAHARNHFRNVGVDVHADEPDPRRRAVLIGAELAGARERVAHPATAAESAAIASIPAVVMRWGVRSFDAGVVPELVTGHTVVSSVNRGAADLRLGGGTVGLTAGFPALSPVQSLTHGVHGIGDTVAVSVSASPRVVTDLDTYCGRIVDLLG